MAIASAIYEGSVACASAYAQEQDRMERERQLQEFENLLAAVETQNLQSQRTVPAELLEEIGEFAARVTIPAPAAVWSARSGSRLHDALLAWQGALLDALRPHRLSYVDRFD